MKEYSIKEAQNGYVLEQKHTWAEESKDNKDDIVSNYGSVWVHADFDGLIDDLAKKLNIPHHNEGIVDERDHDALIGELNVALQGLQALAKLGGGNSDGNRMAQETLDQMRALRDKHMDAVVRKVS